MKISTSYFYQIRFFEPNMIPISTAKWDPKWFTEHVNKNGVVNGLRANILAPGPTCDNLCDGKNNCTSNPMKCKFLRSYRDQLYNLDFKKLYNYLERLAEYARSLNGFSGEPHIVLIVYETPDNICSERAVIQEYFQANGVDCRELKYPLK